ncbi:hypothetical protein F5884DRAFT_863571 [Xylogone sp. PMI_703]|nr:hypothetical protein F5884DRAFT_863571 [Xylogone sp. PMI_703]
MRVSRSFVTFKEFNENPSKCSAWLKEKDRCCGRNIVATDQERKTFLLQSIARNRIHDGEEAEELVGLYFCNGWHRPGGRYAIPHSERRKLLQALFPRDSESETQTLPAVLRQHSPISSPTNETQEPALLQFSDSERPSLSVMPLTVQDAGYSMPKLSEAEILSSSIAQSAIEPSEYETHTSSSFQRIDRTGPTQSEQLSPSLRSESDREDGPVSVGGDCAICLLTLGDPAEAARCAFCGVDLHLNCVVEWLTAPDSATSCIFCQHNLEDHDVFDLIEEIRDPLDKERLQRQYDLKTAQPEHPLSPLSAQEIRRDRPVNVEDDCPICMQELRDHNEVTRCCNCGNDMHMYCAIEWFTTPTNVASCPVCRSKVEYDEIPALITLIPDCRKRKSLSTRYWTKKSSL